MLTRLTVQAFKSLEFVDVELSSVNVFIGANGSGKSNLLEALGFLSAAADGQIDDQALLRRGVRPGTPTSYASSLKEHPTPMPIKVVGQFKMAEGAVEYGVGTLEDDLDFRSQTWICIEERKFIDSNGSLKYRGRRLVGEAPRSLLVAENLEEQAGESSPDSVQPASVREVTKLLSEYGIFTPSTAVLRGTVTDITQRAPVGLAGGQLAEAVRELLKSGRGRPTRGRPTRGRPTRRKFGNLDMDALLTLLDWVDEITVVPPSRELVPASVPTTRYIIRFADRWMSDKKRHLSAYNASEGALYVLFALVLALHPKSPRLFAIENLDQNMHPRLARAAVRLFCEQILASDPPRQVLLTTHNPLVLDGLDLRNERVRLFTVERDSQGATRVHGVPVSEEMLRAVENGLSLSQLWVMGRLGGVPDLF